MKTHVLILAVKWLCQLPLHLTSYCNTRRVPWYFRWSHYFNEHMAHDWVDDSSAIRSPATPTNMSNISYKSSTFTWEESFPYSSGGSWTKCCQYVENAGKVEEAIPQRLWLFRRLTKTPAALSYQGKSNDTSTVHVNSTQYGKMQAIYHRWPLGNAAVWAVLLQLILAQACSAAATDMPIASCSFRAFDRYQICWNRWSIGWSMTI